MQKCRANCEHNSPPRREQVAIETVCINDSLTVAEAAMPAN